MILTATEHKLKRLISILARVYKHLNSLLIS